MARRCEKWSIIAVEVWNSILRRTGKKPSYRLQLAFKLILINYRTTAFGAGRESIVIDETNEHVHVIISICVDFVVFRCVNVWKIEYQRRNRIESGRGASSHEWAKIIFRKLQCSREYLQSKKLGQRQCEDQQQTSIFNSFHKNWQKILWC